MVPSGFRRCVACMHWRADFASSGSRGPLTLRPPCSEAQRSYSVLDGKVVDVESKVPRREYSETFLGAETLPRFPSDDGYLIAHGEIEAEPRFARAEFHHDHGVGTGDEGLTIQPAHMILVLVQYSESVAPVPTQPLERMSPDAEGVRLLVRRPCARNLSLEWQPASGG